MNNSFDLILQNAVTSIVLISSIGLLLLCLLNRESLVTSLIRGLIKQLREEKNQERQNNLQQQIIILFRRCHILQASIAMLVVSTLAGSLMILIIVLSSIWSFNLDLWLKILLIFSFMSISLANILLFVDVLISMRAIKLELDYH
jgi:hypothetical protein